MKTIAFATHAGLPELYPDDHRVVPHLARRGIDVQPAVWDDPRVDWDAFDLIVVRSCWDYDTKVAGFRAWLDRLEAQGSPVWNPAAVLRWNLDKTHLRGLEEGGVAIVPTAWAGPGNDASLASLLDELGAHEAVVKPTVSFSAHGTWRTSRDDVDEERWRVQVAAGAQMVQTFMPEIATGGEWSLVFLAGRFSHAVVKLPASGDFRVQEEYGGSQREVAPDAQLIATCERILEACPGPQLYARVDGLHAGGAFLLMEVELIDPTLYLSDSDSAPETLADAIEEVLRASRS